MFTSPNALLWRGLLAIIIGVVSVVWPSITIGAFAVVFAIYAFSAGVMDAVRAFSSDPAGPVLGWLLLSFLSVVGGVVALAWPGITALALTIWIGTWALVTGTLEIALAFQRGETAAERAAFSLSGLVSVLLAFVLFVRPDIGAVSLATVFGLFSLVWGVTAIIASFQLRHVLRTVDRVVTGV